MSWPSFNELLDKHSPVVGAGN